MKAYTIKTKIISLQDSIDKILDEFIPCCNEGVILCITSKIISLCEKRIVYKKQISKKELINQESDDNLTRNNVDDFYITIKNNLLMPNAGIDESNCEENYYILLPENSNKSAANIWHHIKNRDKLTKLGIIITDSRVLPMRRGVNGVGIGWCGFQPLYSYAQKPDIFNKPLKVTQINILDALATTATLLMGEGNEQTPICVIQDVPKIKFSSTPPTLKEIRSLTIKLEEDLYYAHMQSRI